MQYNSLEYASFYKIVEIFMKCDQRTRLKICAVKSLQFVISKGMLTMLVLSNYEKLLSGYVKNELIGHY